jgi:hypothetical protein
MKHGSNTDEYREAVRVIHGAATGLKSCQCTSPALPLLSSLIRVSSVAQDWFILIRMTRAVVSASCGSSCGCPVEGRWRCSMPPRASSARISHGTKPTVMRRKLIRDKMVRPAPWILAAKNEAKSESKAVTRGGTDSVGRAQATVGLNHEGHKEHKGKTVRRSTDQWSEMRRRSVSGGYTRWRVDLTLSRPEDTSSEVEGG